jgi:primosomal protein N' (replication factor Y) (superfamily II helicase)
VPRRHARIEAEAPRQRAELPAETSSEPPAEPSAEPSVGAPASLDPFGGGFLPALADGRAPRAAWTALPGSDWPAAIAVAVRTTLVAGSGALVVVPDARDVARVDAAFTAALGPGRHVALTADLGPAERYRRWLAVRRGAVPAVVGTRAAMFAPVRRLGLVVVWDDGDDLHAEPRAPYPHVREVLCLRAHEAGVAALLGGYIRTAETAALVAAGWARSLDAPRDVVRRSAPRVQVAGEDEQLSRDVAARAARLPSLAWRVAHDALRTGPVLVQVPRRGYVPAVRCDRCRATARCAHCAGPLSLGGGDALVGCAWCGRSAGGWRCPQCGSGGFRAQAIGAHRTAEELGRAFPSVPVRSSGGDAVLSAVSADPALVVATPGAEPPAPGGYAAALLLDGWALLARPDLRAAEEALRRWVGAAALVRGAAAGGTVVLMADSALAPVQALVRWDPAGYAERELADRRALGFPPAVRLAVLTGPAPAVAELLTLAQLPPGADVLGPVPGREGAVRALVRVPKAHGAALARGLRAAQGVRSARKVPDPVRVQIDPVEIG